MRGGTPVAQFLALLQDRGTSTSVDLDPSTPAGSAAPDGTVFLSVIVLSRGDTSALSELLLCLSAQSSDDFEVFLVSGGGTVLADDTSLLASQPLRLRRRLSVITPSGSVTTDVDAAIAGARGTHVAVVEETSLLMGSWVETFHSRVPECPERVLVSASVVQPSEHLEVRGAQAVRSSAAPRPTERLVAPILRQLLGVPEPTAAWVLPLAAVREAGVRVGESEDLAVELRRFLAVLVERCGVDEFAEVLVVDRVLHATGTSAYDSPVTEWGALDARPWLLPAGSVVHLRDLARRELSAQARRDHAEQSAADVVARLERMTRRARRLEERLEVQRAEVRRLRGRVGRLVKERSDRAVPIPASRGPRDWVPEPIVKVARRVRRGGAARRGVVRNDEGRG
jgi:hypothetical protein